jgi:AcrR family transcriptional regulator
MTSLSLNRDQLLERLSVTFRRYGYEGASLSIIATSVGVVKASLYHHFPNGKQQIAEEVLDWTREWFEKQIFQVLETTQPPRQRLMQMMQSLSRHYANGQLSDIMGLFSLGAEREIFFNRIFSFYERWISTLQIALIDSGLSRNTAEKRAFEVLERLMGAVIIHRGIRDKKDFEQVTLDILEQSLAGSSRSTIWTNRTASSLALSQKSF